MMRDARRESRGRRRRQRGIALIATLFVLFFLLSLALAYGFAVNLELNFARNFMNDLQAQYCARAGIYRALAELKIQARSGTFAYPRGDTPEEVDLLQRYEEIYRDVPLYVNDVEVGRYTVKFKDNFGQTGLGPMDESSLININRLAQRGDRATLERLFKEAISNEDVIRKLLDTLIDYVDADDMKLLEGAESKEYGDIVPPIPIRNGPMRDVNELLNVIEVLRAQYPELIDDTVWFGEDWNNNGVLDPNEDDGYENPPYDNADGVLNRGIKDYITVDSDSDQVNPNTASPDVMRIMYPENYEQMLADRQNTRLPGNSSVFRIRSYGKAGGYTHVMEWVVRLGGEGGYPSVIRMYSL